MKILITGGGGQLAWELERTAPTPFELQVLVRADLDITDRQAVLDAVEAFRPDAVINAAAYTQVDAAENDSEQAYRVNEVGASNLAQACSNIGGYLLHISTDFVFDGNANRPYAVCAKTNPLGIYGASKLAGEVAVQRNMTANWAIIRTAWVYSSHGSNFVKTMLRLMGEKPVLNVIADQVGSPTWAKQLAEVCWAGVAARISGVFHYTGAGVASWYDFAVAIQTIGLAKGLLQKPIPILPIPTEMYPTPAKRPTYSVLDNSQIYTALPGLVPHHWREQLEQMLHELAAEKINTGRNTNG